MPSLKGIRLLMACAAAGLTVSSAALASQQQNIVDLFSRFQSTCAPVFETGRAHLPTLVDQLPKSFLTHSDDGDSSYLVWLTDDYSQGTAVIIVSDETGDIITCDVSLGDYESFNANSAEATVKQLAQSVDGLSVSGGALKFAAGSQAKLTELYGTDPLRYMRVEGVFGDAGIPTLVEINPTGSMNLTSHFTRKLAQ
jgi:hypothetical protein